MIKGDMVRLAEAVHNHETGIVARQAVFLPWVTQSDNQIMRIACRS
jgi:hypothetical protein